MKSRIELTTLVVVVFVFAPLTRAAEAEDGAIPVLQSDKPPAEKAAACRALKNAGTAKAVPALAALLADAKLSHWARVALECIPGPEAGAALRDALPKTSGVLKAGICDTIGARRDAEALPALVELLKDDDAQIVSSAASAIGKIGGDTAVKALVAARATASEPLRLVMADALLQCRAQFPAQAFPQVYQQLANPKEPEHVRVAAMREMLRAANTPAAYEAYLTGDDKAAHLAALALLRENAGATAAFAAALPKPKPKIQVALIEGLALRGDAAAIPAIAAALPSPDAGVRMAALKALGLLGDGSVVGLLAEKAAASEGIERDTARASLARLRGAGAREAMLAALGTAKPATQAEVARALSLRRDAQAVPTLVKMAKEKDEATRLAAYGALALLGDETCVAGLAEAVTKALSEPEMDAAEKALSSICRRSKKPDECVGPLVAAMNCPLVPARCALLRAAGRAGGAEALKALRAGMQDKEETVRDAAIRGMAECAGVEAAPDLLKLAREAQSPVHRVLALRGCVRLIGLAAERPVDERLKLCEGAMSAAQTPDDKKLVLSALAGVPHSEALKLAEKLAGDEATRPAAEIAWVRIAAALISTSPDEAKAALRKLAETGQGTVRDEARKVLDGMDQFSGYINTWQAAGPYRQPGKECQALFDIAFPPEQADAKDVVWKAAPLPADAALGWQTDLLPLCGGDQCAVYMRARVFSPKEQAVKLEIGSDDGIKLWVNGKIVHANNTMRPIAAGQDKAQATLKEGWNEFLAKVTQNNMGCGACVRIRAADGSSVPGLKFDGGK
jgi:HEAT repeat protein